MQGLPLKVDPEEHLHSLYEGIEYKEFWNGMQRSKLDELEQALVSNLLPLSGQRIIDVGCGYGRLANCYQGRFQQIIMFDGSMSLLRQAVEQTGRQEIYIAGDALHLPFQPASFDTALMIRVFHHIPDSQACLSGLHRILSNNGNFIFSYRNKRNALRAIQWFMGRNTENPFTTETEGLGSTLISHHPAVVHRMLLESRFANIQYYGAGVFDWFAGKLGPLGRYIPSGRRISGLLGNSKMAPWILCKAISQENTNLIDSREIADLLQCPCCGGNIFGNNRRYICAICGTRFPVEDGIIDMRV